MKSHLQIFILAVFLSPWCAFGAQLSEVSDTLLVEILNNFEILAERREPPYATRVLRLREHGECNGTPQSCPQATLYIAISNFGERPDQKLYRLPKAFGWEFVRWKALPKKEGRDSFIIFELKRKMISKNIAEGWWSESTYQVQVNPWKGDLKEIQ